MSKEGINHFLHERLGELRIAVIGDVMLDRYLYGKVERISPEAPVPINHICKTKETLGGAANVASNLASLTCKTTLLSYIGNDADGLRLEELLDKKGVKREGLFRSNERTTIAKIRVLDSRQQMIRLDFEQIHPLGDGEIRNILDAFKTLCQEGLDGVVLSDYGKGFFTESLTKELIRIAKENQVITVVDPKGTLWSKYEGADYITPNVNEVSKFLNRSVVNSDSDIVKAAKEIREQVAINNIVITRSEKGITLYNDIGVWHNPAVEQSVYDVSGAGDTVVATLIAASAAQLSTREMLWLANAAAGVVVAQVGTYPIHKQELIDVWMDYVERPKGDCQVLTVNQLAKLVNKWQQIGESVVFTNGCFDILHRGHINYLKEAAQLGNRFIIAVNSDASVKRLKGELRPINKEEDRAYLLANLAFVDAVCIFDEDTPYEALEEIHPNILVKGGDYTIENVVGRDLVDEVRILPFTEGYSTTKTIQTIEEMSKENSI